MNKVYKEFDLGPNDVFAHKHYKIIVRGGIDKIQSRAKIAVKYELLKADFSVPSGYVVIVKAIGTKLHDDGTISTIETFGECMPSNNKNEYPVAMAEKRAMSRAVLKLAGLYEQGFFSEDEADDFAETVKKGRQTIGEGNAIKRTF